MSCLDATFTLTPQSPFYLDSSLNNSAYLFCYGADFSTGSPLDFSSLYSSNRFFFHDSFGADPNLDYSQWANRKKAQFLKCQINLAGYAAANKQLVYSDADLLQNQQLVYGDNQFLIEIDSLDQWIQLYFIHAGGHWFFRGLSGYVV